MLCASTDSQRATFIWMSIVSSCPAMIESVLKRRKIGYADVDVLVYVNISTGLKVPLSALVYGLKSSLVNEVADVSVTKLLSVYEVTEKTVQSVLSVMNVNRSLILKLDFPRLTINSITFPL